MKDNKSILFITNLGSKMSQGVSISETLTSLLSANGWRVYSASGKLNRILRLFDMLVTTWKFKNDYDCAFIEVFSGKAFIWAELVCLLLNILHKPFILGLFGGNLPNFSKRNPRRVDRVLRSARIVVAPSRYLLRQLKFYTSANIIVFPYGVLLNRLQYRLRTKLEPKLITMRGFHSIYCPWVAVETVALLRDDYPNINLTMSGGNKKDGSLEKTERTIRKNALEHLITITGYIDNFQLENRLMSADILINIPVIDNTPVSVLQAMACGLCIVSSNVGGLPDLIEDGMDGLLVPPNDPQAVAAAVRRLLTEPGLAARLSANARKKAQQFDWLVILPRWENLFNELFGT